MATEFDPNNMSVVCKFEVYVDRLRKKLPVASMRFEKMKTREDFHIWGFAADGHQLREFDSTWGDVVQQTELSR